MTETVVPTSRRQASRTVANASGKQVVQPGLQLALELGFQLVKPLLQPVALDRVGARVLGGPHLLELLLDRAGTLREALAEALGLGLELGLAECLESLLGGVDLVHHRLEAFALAVESSAEDRGHQGFDHAGSKYNRCRATYSATASGTQYCRDSPSRALRRTSVAEISMAGTSIVREMSAEVGAGMPARPNTTTVARRATSEASRQASSSTAASAPISSVSSTWGSRAWRARSVSTVYEGPARPSSAQLELEARCPRHGQLQHRGSMLGGRPVSGALERLKPCGHESQRIEAEHFEGDLSDDQMAVMDGIERPAEQAYPRSMRHRPCRQGTESRREPRWDGSGGGSRRSRGRPPGSRAAGTLRPA